LELNILNQNPNYFPEIKDLKNALPFYENVTITTAHVRYNQDVEVGDRLLQSSYLGTPVGPDKMKKIPYDQKREILLVSHDPHPRREEVLSLIKERLPKLDIIVVKNLSFEEYTNLQKKAKWTITFGEGMDAYFVRSFMYGGIGFAVFNEEFFTSDFKDLQTVYPSEEELINRICSDISQLDTKDLYFNYNDEVRTTLSKYYNNGDYEARVVAFHKHWVEKHRVSSTLN
jgi:hypothetical protein